MDFLLECVGFAPEWPLEDLVARALRDGEPLAWRGAAARHRRLPLTSGLELRVEREDDRAPWNVVPYYATPRRLRVAIDAIRALPDSRFDALLVGWAAPSSDVERGHAEQGDGGAVATAQGRGAYPLSAYVTDARRLPARLPQGHVLAISVAGFALDVTSLVECDECTSPVRIEPLGSAADPGGCAELSLRIASVVRQANPITGAVFDRIEVEAPERPLDLFVSRWQLERDGLPLPRAGMRIEGTFLFTGRIAGGLPGPRTLARRDFG